MPRSTIVRLQRLALALTSLVCWLSVAIAADPPGESADELVMAATNPQVPFSERKKVLHSFEGLPTATGDEVLRRLVSGPDNEMSHWATNYCAAHQRLGVIADELATVISHWSAEDQYSILGTIERQPIDVQKSTAVRSIAKAVLSNHKPQLGSSRPHDRDARVIAVQILVAAGDDEARKLIIEALTATPLAPQLWLSLIKVGGSAPSDEVELAKSVYQNVDAPKLTRVAAALWMAKHDATMTKDTRDKIDAFVAQNLDEWVLGVMAPRPTTGTYLETDRWMKERSEASHAIVVLPSSVSDPALRQLIREANADTAYMVFNVCINTHRQLDGILDEFAIAVPKWPPGYQRNVLGTIVRQPAGVRKSDAVLRMSKAMLSTPQPQKGVAAGTGSDPTGMAAWVLADAGDAEARQFIDEALKAAPLAQALWLALNDLGGAISPDEIRLAESTYQNVAASRVARVAAALAIAKQNSAASKFALGEIHAYVDRSASVSLESLLGQAFDGDQEASQKLHDFKRELRLVEMLRYANLTVDDPLLAKLLNSPNDQCQTLGGLVMAQRWPSLLLDDRFKVTKSRQYKALLAMAARAHPELRETIVKKMGQSALGAEMGKVGDLPLDAVFENITGVTLER